MVPPESGNGKMIDNKVILTENIQIPQLGKLQIQASLFSYESQ